MVCVRENTVNLRDSVYSQTAGQSYTQYQTTAFTLSPMRITNKRTAVHFTLWR